MHDNDDEYFDDELDIKSKTQIKKEMLALTALGKNLTSLKPEELEKIPLSEELKNALEESKKITQNSARKRHFQFIGKLMRKTDSEAIVAAYEQIVEGHKNAARQLHAVEKWRDDLLSGDNSAFESFVDLYPITDRQQMRNLIRSSRKEKDQNKPPASSRKLFQLIRETINT